MNLGVVRQPMVDFYHITSSALRTVHAQPLRRGTESLPEFRRLLGQFAHIACAPLSVLGPVGVPVRSVGTSRTRLLTASDPLLPQTDVHIRPRGDRTDRLEPRSGEDDKPLEFVRIEFPDRFEQIPIDAHRR